MRDRFHNSGYTLVEVLVAFMILALALTVLLQIFSSGLRNVSVSSEYSHAVLVAESQLATAGITATLRPGETRGNDGGKFSWTRVVRNYTPFTDRHERMASIRAYYITVTVEWPHAGRMRQVNLSSIRLGVPQGTTS